MRTSAEGLCLHHIASVKAMLGKGPIGIILKIVIDSQIHVTCSSGIIGTKASMKGAAQ